MKSKLTFGALASAAIVAGCANGSAIYRKDSLSSDSLILDAKQRLVANFDAKPWEVGPLPTDRQGPPRYIAPSRIICPEPSPDVAASLSTAITASLNQINADGSRASANAGFAAAESLAQLGQRLATTQLLRDELADLCRSYANGAISTTNYTLRLAQLDEKMVTLLTAEMIAGSFNRDSVTINGSTAFAGGTGGSGPTSEQITAAKAEQTAAQADLDKKSAALTTHLDAVPKPPADTPAAKMKEWQEANAVQIKAHQDKTDVLRNEYRTAQDRVTRANNTVLALADPTTTASNAVPTARALALGGQSVSTYGGNGFSAQQLVALQSNYLERDKGGAIIDTCITRMNEDLLFPKKVDLTDETVRRLQQELSDKTMERQKLDSERNQKQRELMSQARPAMDDAYNKYMALAEKDAGRAAAKAAMDKLEQELKIKYDAIELLYQPRLDGLTAELGAKERQIASETQGKSQAQTSTDQLCEKLIDKFYDQISLTQNTRQELELKAMEADVQKARFGWLAGREQFCLSLLAKYDGQPVDKLKADPNLVACREPALLDSDPHSILGQLSFTSNTGATKSAGGTTSSENGVLLAYLRNLEDQQRDTAYLLEDLMDKMSKTDGEAPSQKPAQPGGAPSPADGKPE